ncbi:MAG: hypothetical protein ABL984_11135 [Pyrinomonadaceae bacterium]
MSGVLSLNPYLQLQTVGDGSEEFILSAPQKGRGLQAVRIEKALRPELFELFAELSSTSLDFLQPESDISDSDRRFLAESGILVEPNAVPKLPSFACDLSDVNPVSVTGGPLQVNSHFRFDPFDLSTFTAKIRDAHLSPFRPIAWTRSSVFGVDMGYWLEPSDAAVISCFSPGEEVGPGLDSELRGRLLAAEILVDNDLTEQTNQDRQRSLDSASDSFRSKGYGVIEWLLPTHQMKAYRRFYREYVSQGFMPFGDNQVPNRYRQHNEPLAAFLHHRLQPLMSIMAGEEVIPSYVYAASYKGGAVLDPHVDRPQCEYSISFQVDYEPEASDHLSPWALCVEPLGGRERHEINWGTIQPEAAQKFNLASGDALFYKGCELVHYRDALPEGHRSTSLFFHFVYADFAGNLD